MNNQKDDVYLTILINRAKQRHVYHECLLARRTMSDVAKEIGISREAVRQRIDKYVKRHGLVHLSQVRINDNGRECLKCHIWKPWDQYGIGPNNGTRGHKSACKGCEVSAVSYRPTAEEIFSNRWKINGGGCWIWTGATAGDGYPRMYVPGGLRYAYRWAYEHFVGPIPNKMRITRLCEDRLCVNPEHLTLMTRSEVRRRWDSACVT